MKIMVVTDEEMKVELCSDFNENTADVQFSSLIKDAAGYDVCIDLLFDNTGERVSALSELNAKVKIVNAVCRKNVPLAFVRLNGWPTLLKRKIAEVAKNENHSISEIENIFACFSKKVEWVPDISGMITPRILSMIINEAFFTLGENVSNKEEIDIAMKLGTNYPYGPFEWGERIGLKKIFSLLKELSQEQPRYLPAPFMQKEFI